MAGPGAAGRPGNAGAQSFVKQPGRNLKAMLLKNGIDAARVPPDLERVGRVVADRLDAQRDARRVDARRRAVTCTWPARPAGHEARAAAQAEDLIGARRHRRRLGEDRRRCRSLKKCSVELGMIRFGPAAATPARAGCRSGRVRRARRRDRRRGPVTHALTVVLRHPDVRLIARSSGT